VRPEPCKVQGSPALFLGQGGRRNSECEIMKNNTEKSWGSDFLNR
jgi:hypothetical protein